MALKYTEHDDIINIPRPDPPCKKGCPAGIDIPRYIRFVGMGKFDEALAVIREKIPFPGVCGRVCPHPCEKRCNLGRIERPVAIRVLKCVASERGKFFPNERAKKAITGKKIAIVGGGPAGLTAAFYLAKLGHSVTIFEAQVQLGGMMRYGIPAYRLPRNILDNEITDILDLGIDVQPNCKLGKDFTLEQLRIEGYDAIFIGIGCHWPLTLKIPGEKDLGDVIDGLAFLRQVHQGYPPKPNNRLVIIGGGNVALDSARVAKRLGFGNITILFSQTKEKMPAFYWEADEALEEKIHIEFLTSPIRIKGEDGKVKAIECLRVRMGEPDASGRRSPVPVEGSEFNIEADVVVPAIGEVADLAFLGSDSPIVENNGLIAADKDTLHTGMEGVYAGGDVVSGPRSVIEAVASGRTAAISIDKYLGGSGDIDETLAPPENFKVTLPVSLFEDRVRPPMLLPLQRMSNFEEIELNLDEEIAVNEAGRCMWCDLSVQIDSEKCSECRTCQMICSFAHTGLFNPSKARIQVPIDGQGEIVFTKKCIKCNLCVRSCVYGALSLQKRCD